MGQAARAISHRLEWVARAAHAARYRRRKQFSRCPPFLTRANSAFWERWRSANFAWFFTHTNLLSLKPFSAVVTSQDFSIDTNFGWFKFRDTFPLRRFLISLARPLKTFGATVYSERYCNSSTCVTSYIINTCVTSYIITTQSPETYCTVRFFYA